ncbi:MAG: hypothetical protein M1451_05515 [Acidobacteria bacterium]|nr:hypothetical protein [Acidobacteriota bacterium]
MVAVIIFAFALVAVGQFWLSWWRATVGTVAASPLSDRIRAAASLEGDEVRGGDFQTLLTLFETCPSLKKDSQGLGPVRAYYSVVNALSRMFSAVPAVAEWAQNEMATCARYAAVCVDQRMQRTRTMLAEMRSY